jgi:hypothetical protein
MIVTPLPWRGGVLADLRDDGRCARVAPHPSQELVSLSLWRDDQCIATHQMSATDVARMLALLAEALTVLGDPPTAAAQVS